MGEINYIHKELADGRWKELSLCEQMGNIGSEVHRVLKWREKEPGTGGQSGGTGAGAF